MGGRNTSEGMWFGGDLWAEAAQYFYVAQAGQESGCPPVGVEKHNRGDVVWWRLIG